MPAAHAARAARARGGRWHRAQRGRARHRLRGRDRQARGQPLRGGQALRRVAQGEAGAGWRFRGRRLDARQGLARATGRAAGGLLGARQAPLRLPRGLGLRRSQPRGREGRGSSRSPSTPARSTWTPELNAPTTWVAPKLVAEVAYQGWTDDGHLRAPVFLRLRDDIDAKKVRREQGARRPRWHLPIRAAPIEDVVAQLERAKGEVTLAVDGQRFKVTNLDRVYWPANEALRQPAVTKRDLMRYYAQVSPYMLPHLADRPLTMIRMPDGIGGQRFFQKHWTQARPDFVEAITVFSGHKDEEHEYLLANNLPTLLWLAQSGTLELHVWHSRARLGPDTKREGHRLRHLARIPRGFDPQLPGLRALRHRPVHLLGQGGAGRRARAQHAGVREGQGGRVPRARAAGRHGPARRS